MSKLQIARTKRHCPKCGDELFDFETMYWCYECDQHYYKEKEAEQELKCAVCQTEIGEITETTTLCKECDEKLDGQGVYN